jgi:UMF1 family MFS transporter
VLNKLGLHRKELRAWAMYDWANSAYQTTIVASIFPIYYAKVASAGSDSAVADGYYLSAKTVAILLTAVFAPILGALADTRPLKKTLLGIFLGVGVISTGAMYWVEQGDWQFGAILALVSSVAVACTLVFYDSLLPHITTPDEVDRVSTAGYSLGYVGGGVLVAINLAMIQQPQWFGIPDAGVATRLSFLSVAVWWLLFSIPLFRNVREPKVPHQERPSSLGAALVDSGKQLGSTFRELRMFRHAFLFLIAFFIYNDGVQTLIVVASLYGARIGIDTSALITALLITQFTGIPFAFLFGMLAGKIGARAGICIGLTVYAGVSIYAYFLHSAYQFYILAIVVGMVQGCVQALSRSLFSSMVPRSKSSQFFAFFSVFERYASLLGPALFAWAAARGHMREAIPCLVVFFVVGMIVLSRVDVKAGQAAAQAADAATT